MHGIVVKMLKVSVRINLIVVHLVLCLFQVSFAAGDDVFDLLWCYVPEEREYLHAVLRYSSV